MAVIIIMYGCDYNIVWRLLTTHAPIFTILCYFGFLGLPATIFENQFEFDTSVLKFLLILSLLIPVDVHQEHHNKPLDTVYQHESTV